VATIDAETGRYRQRRRTRSAIVGAAAELVRAGNTQPSVNEIAEAADVSRRTVYQYFPRVEQLLLDATIGLLSQAMVDDAIESAASTDGDAVARVSALVRATMDLAPETLSLGRALVRLTVASPPADGEPLRGYRRIDWIEKALEPLRDQLDEAVFERLVSALAMVIGWEALVVLSDIRGLSIDDQVDVSSWAAKALIDAALRER
jgi:AcrR family transcriptional regulator